MNAQAEGWLAGRVFYTIIAAYYWALTIYLDNLYIAIGELPKGEWYLNEVGYSSYGGRYKYLTHWNLIIQRTYFSAVCIAFLIKFDRMRSVTKFFFNSIILPMSFAVTAIFWLLYSINRELIFPKFYDEIYPWWVNHTLHSICAVLALTELLIFPCTVPQTLKWERLSNLTLILCYTAWLPWASYQSGVWPYSFLRKLNNIQISLFFTGCAILCICLHSLGVIFRRSKWGSYNIRVEYEAKNKSE